MSIEPYFDDYCRAEDLVAARYYTAQMTRFRHLPLSAYHRTDRLTAEERLTKHLDERV